MEQNNWVSVKDTLPPQAKLVLLMLHSGKFEIWCTNQKELITDMKVTHWQYLPEPPNKTI